MADQPDTSKPAQPAQPARPAQPAQPAQPARQPNPRPVGAMSKDDLRRQENNLTDEQRAEQERKRVERSRREHLQGQVERIAQNPGVQVRDHVTGKPVTEQRDDDKQRGQGNQR
jgi:hypothetical protein